jgi:signal transduction histidine kinase
MLVTLNGHKGDVISVEQCPAQDYLTFLHGEFNEEPYGQRFNPILLMVAGRDGKILASSTFDQAFHPLVEKLFLQEGGLAGYRRISDERHSLLFFISRLHDGNLLLVAQNMDNFDANLAHLLVIFGCSIIVFIVVGVCLAFLLAHSVSDGLTRISQTASDIAQGHYGKRVEYKSEGVEIELLIKSFNHMTDKTEKMLKELENVTDDIAHDLRTPLTRMKARAELELASQTNMDFAASIAEDCEEMLSIINIMLEISRIEKQTGNVLRTQVNVNALLEKLHEAFLTLAEDRNILFHVILPEKPLTIHGNSRQLEQMAANLIDNAIKYTQDGGSVNVLLEQKDDHLLLSVSDTGIGIRQEDIPRVFDRFFRGDASRSTHGNGLGLSMVKAIAESMGGSVTVESAVGNGSMFVVSLPLNHLMA